MPNDANKIELAELEIERLIQVMHKSLTYQQIYEMFRDYLSKLKIQAGAEAWLKEDT